MIVANPIGRPSKKSPEMLQKIFSLLREGKTEHEVAEIVGISPGTITHWKKMDFEFFTTLKESKLEADNLVEASLLKRAMGFEYTYRTERATKEGACTVEETVYYPPDTQAALQWLYNRTKNWRNKNETEHKVLLLKKDLLGDLSEQELIELTQEEIKKIDVHNQDS